jgi:hypothetical protein
MHKANDDDVDGEWSSYTHLRRFDLLKIAQATSDQFLTIHIYSYKFNDSRSNSHPLYKSNINIDHSYMYSYRRRTFIDQNTICSH